MYKPVARNFEGIQHEQLRKLVDARFNAAHDALSVAYYEGKAFVWKGVDHGILTKQQFDRLHSLIFHKRDVALYQVNLAQRLASEADAELEIAAQAATAAIATLKADGVDLEV